MPVPIVDPITVDKPAAGPQDSPKPELKPEPKPDTPASTDPMTTKLEGDNIPEKFRGKTVKEVLEIHATTEGAKTKAETEVAQWAAYVKDQQTAAQAAADDKTPKFNPLDHLSEEQARSVDMISASRVSPLLEAMGGLMKEVAKSNHPDWNEHEVRATKIYDNLAPAYKFHRDYGWNFAINFARAEAMKVKPPGPKPPTGGPSLTGDTPGPKKLTLNEDQKKWAKIQGMTEEKYAEYLALQTPEGGAK